MEQNKAACSRVLTEDHNDNPEGIHSHNTAAANPERARSSWYAAEKVKRLRKPDARQMIVLQPRKSLLHLDLAAIWEYRELLYFLVWREHKVRYKQAAIGAAWAVCQPLVTLTIFTVIFGKFARMPSDGLPYPVFAYAALLPWNFFSQAVSRSGLSLVINSQLITKVYFPRLMIPISAALVPILDFFISFLMLLGLMTWYGISPTMKGILLFPILMVLILVSALSISLWLAPLNVRYRDVAHVLPHLIQVWMYLSPVVYPLSMVPHRWRFLYSLNPMVGVIECFRWALLGKEIPNIEAMAISFLMTAALFLGGLIYFRKAEGAFSDIV